MRFRACGGDPAPLRITRRKRRTCTYKSPFCPHPHRAPPFNPARILRGKHMCVNRASTRNGAEWQGHRVPPPLEAAFFLREGSMPPEAGRRTHRGQSITHTGSIHTRSARHGAPYPPPHGKDHRSIATVSPRGKISQICVRRPCAAGGLLEALQKTPHPARAPFADYRGRP